MIAFRALRKGAALCAFLLIGTIPLQGQTEDQEWRTWVSSDGAEIEAYLKGVSAEGIVIVRRDGREFVAPLERFSEADRKYVIEWAQKSVPSAANFRAIDFEQAEVPPSHEIEGVEHVRPGSGEPAEVAAIKMVLNFHEINYEADGLSKRISVREGDADVLIPAADLTNALQGLPVETEAFNRPPPGANGPPPAPDTTIFNAIKKAISLNLPVIIGHRPEFDLDTPEFIGVAVAYDQRSLEIIEPAGSRKSNPLDWQDLEETLIYALVVFPTIEPVAAAQIGQPEPSSAFLSSISAVIRGASAQGAPALADLLNEKGFTTTLKDINRTDYRDQLGQTRSFARQGGIPQITAALNSGNVVVVPQEYESGRGFALVYGRADDAFAAVEYFENGTFNRRSLSSSELAQRWLTREDRTFRLELIQIAVPKTTPATPPPPPSRPPSRPPPPPPGN